jgi:hypothetical protein
MRTTLFLILSSALVFGCGGSSENGGSGGKSGGGGTDAGVGGSGGTGGASGGTGGASGGTGGASGGTGGASGGSAGASGGSAGASGGSAGASGGSAGAAGSGGTAGQSTGGSAGASPADPECKNDADCQIVNDCCNCIAIPKSEQPPSCGISTCLVASCTPLGNPSKAHCIAGRCSMGFDCDDSTVSCASPSPVCNPGSVPLISGNCYQGSCVPADECDHVASCSDCTGNLVCANYATQLGPEPHCVTIPSTCGSDFTCACMGPSVCLSPFSTCSDLSGLKGVGCSCPNC